MAQIEYAEYVSGLQPRCASGHIGCLFANGDQLFLRVGAKSFGELGYDIQSDHLGAGGELSPLIVLETS